MTASGRAALAALGVVVTSFIAATAYSEYRAGSIDAAAHQLAESVAPGIQYLTNGCEDLRQLGALLREADARRDHVERSWQRAQAELETYLSLETTAESPRFAHQLAALQSMIGSAVGRWDPHDPAQQREVTGRILPAVEEISGTALVALDRAASHSACCSRCSRRDCCGGRCDWNEERAQAFPYRGHARESEEDGSMKSFQWMEGMLERALAFTYAALDEPTGPQVAEARRCAAEVLPNLGGLKPRALALDDARRLMQLVTQLRTALNLLDRKVESRQGEDGRN